MAEKSTLLIVDDESSVCRALRRIIRGRADEVVIVSNMTDANLVIDTKKVTHVLCDHLLGPGQPRGMEVASTWKDRYGSIRKLVILTGSNLASQEPPPGIDLVLPKTTDPLQLADLIGL